MGYAAVVFYAMHARVFMRRGSFLPLGHGPDNVRRHLRDHVANCGCGPGGYNQADGDDDGGV